MRLTTLTALGCALLVTPALAETLGEKTGVNSTLGIAPTTADFVHEAAISDMFEVQSSKLAAAQTKDQTKTFAEKMIKAHTATTETLKPLAMKAKVEVPAKLDDAHQKMLDKLKGLKGDDFTKQYDSDQVSGHKDAVSLFERYSKGGENADIKSFASKTLPDIQDHLKMAEQLGK